MKARIFLPVLTLVLVLVLAACEPARVAAPGSVAPAPSPSAEVPMSPPASTPTTLSETQVRELIEDSGAFWVLNVISYEGDYLVELTNRYMGDHSDDQVSAPEQELWRALYWVFGETGEKVWLNREVSHLGIDSYRITAPGHVEITTAWEYEAPANGPKRIYELIVAVDSHGRVQDDYEGQRVIAVEMTPNRGWIPLDGTGYASSSAKLHDGGITGRYEQVYDARLEVNGVSLSFIPSGDPERFSSFFPAVTTVPITQCSFDPAERVFTIRFANTALESDGITDEELNRRAGGTDSPYLGIYPHAFPEGKLGADGHFVKGAAVAQEGEDTVVTMKLTDAAYAYQVESGNLGGDHFPLLRVSFRGYTDYMDR